VGAAKITGGGVIDIAGGGGGWLGWGAWGGKGNSLIITNGNFHELRDRGKDKENANT